MSLTNEKRPNNSGIFKKSCLLQSGRERAGGGGERGLGKGEEEREEAKITGALGKISQI